MGNVNEIINKNAFPQNFQEQRHILHTNENNCLNIKDIKKEIESIKLTSDIIYGWVSSLIQLENMKIVTGCNDGSISINSIDLNKKEWKRIIYKENAHNDRVVSLCDLNDNRLVSGSDDKTIKVWNISMIELNQIKIIKEHNDTIWKIIPLSNLTFASCSSDGSVRIWESIYNYQQLSILIHNDNVISILRLKGKIF